MKPNTQPIVILMAEDDADDRLMAKEAFQESHVFNELRFVENGVELLEYLHHQGQYTDQKAFPLPDIILLDLNMPRKNGREALEEIKADANLRYIPIIVMTTSAAEEDILRSYDTGAASYITKPVTFEGLVDVIRGLEEYWVQIVRLPPASAKEAKR